tara:strand:- start:457 stop:621 length:165 start_codon:yes stop_codon:yes gene_type:complete
LEKAVGEIHNVLKIFVFQLVIGFHTVQQQLQDSVKVVIVIEIAKEIKLVLILNV